MRATLRPLGMAALAGYLLALAGGVLSLALSGALTAGLSGADEPAHFLNGYFIGRYLDSRLGMNPLAFATDFYLHYPKISIGHWPPAYYGLLGLLFLVVPPTLENAFVVNLLVSALPAAGVAAALAHVAGLRAALAGALVYATLPLVLGAYTFFMLDQALAACTTAVAMVWVAYVLAPGWRRAAGLAVLSAAAVLVKGNGWLVLLLPLFHIVLLRAWRLLLRAELYLAAAFAALLVVPWYLLTSKIAADGFNYQAGLGYAAQALVFNVRVLLGNAGVAGLLLAALGVGAAWRQRAGHPRRWVIASGCLSLILATLALQSLVPVDLVDRYLAPALPAVAVLAVLGVRHVHGLLAARHGARPAGAAGIVLAVALLLPGIGYLGRIQPKVDLRMSQAVPALAAGGTPVGWIIDGSSGAEGAFIVEMALRDPALEHYAVRASKLFADSNFMGAQYRLRFANAPAVLAEIRRLGIRGVTLVRINDESAFEHSSQLARALALPDSTFRRTGVLTHGNRRGTTEVYESVEAPALDVAAVRGLGRPAKAAAFDPSAAWPAAAGR